MAQSRPSIAGGLHWVRGELDQSLARARGLIEQYMDAPEDQLPLQQAAVELHQVRGTAAMIQCAGVALLADEMKLGLQDLMQGRIQEPETVYAALLAASVQLGDYIDALSSGVDDCVLVFQPVINELRLARGRAVVTDAELLASHIQNLGLQLPMPQSPTRVDGAAQAAARKYLQVFQNSLLQWLKGQNQDLALNRMGKIGDHLSSITTAQPVYQLWRVYAAAIESLLSGQMSEALEFKRLFGRVGQQIKLLAEKGEAGAVEQANTLSLQFLFYVGRGEGHGPRTTLLRRAFALDAHLPSAERLAQMRAKIGGPNTELLNRLADELRVDFNEVKDAIDLVVRAGVKGPDDLSNIEERLKRIGNTLNMLGLSTLDQVIANQRHALADLGDGSDVEAAREVWTEAAIALLRVEHSLEGALFHQLHNPSGQRALEPEQEYENSTPHSADLRESVDALLRESLIDLAKLKSQVDGFLKTGNTGNLSEAPRMLNEVQSGLRILQDDRAADLCHELRRYTLTTRFAALTAGSEQADRFADAVASIEYYLEALQQRQPDASQILDSLQDYLGQLEFGAVEESPAPGAGTDAELGATAPEAAAPEAQAEDAAALPEARVEAVAPEVAKVPDDVDPEIREIFLEEAAEVLEQLRTTWPRFQRDPENLNELKEMRRAFHTLKGSGRMVGADAIGEFGWAVENLLNRCLDGSRAVSAAVEQLIAEALETLPVLIEHFRDARPADAVAAPLVQRAEQLLVSDAAPAEPSVVEVFVRDAQQHLQQIDDWLQGLGGGAASPDDAVIRSLHTLRGGAGIVDAQAISAVAAALEEQLSNLRAAKAKLDSSGVALMQELMPQLRAWVDQLPRGPIASEQAQLWLEKIAALAEALPESLQDEAASRSLAELFTSEALTLLQDIEQQLAAWQAHPDSAQFPQRLQLGFRSLGGAADSAGCPPIARVAEAFDQRLREVASSVTPEPEFFEAFNGCLEQLFQMLDAHRQGSLVDDGAQLAAAIAGLRAASSRVDDSQAEPADTSAVPGSSVVEDARISEVDPELLAIFQGEAEELLEQLDQQFDVWERKPDDNAPLAELARVLHTLKGSARMADQTQIGDVSHRLEGLLEQVAAGQQARDSSLFSICHNVVDGLYRAAQDIKRGQTPDLDNLLSELAAFIAGDNTASATAADVDLPPAAEAAWGDADDAAVVRVLDDAAPDAASVALSGDELTVTDSAPDFEPQPSGQELRQPDQSGAEDEQPPVSTQRLEAAELAPEGADDDAAADVPDHDLVQGEDEQVAEATGPTELDAAAAADQAGELDTEFEPELAEIFSGEAAELLESLQRALNQLNGDPQDAAAMAEVQRALHTFKGGARMAGLEQMGMAAHQMESRVMRLDSGQDDASDNRHFARLHEDLEDLQRRHDALQRLRAASAPPVAKPAAVKQKMAAGNWDPELFWAPEQDDSGSALRRETARVAVESLDRMLNQAGEISIFRSRLEQQNSSIQYQLDEMAATIDRIRDQLRQMDSETDAQIEARGLRAEESPGEDRYADDFDPLEMDRYSRMQELSRALTESISDLASLHLTMNEVVDDGEALLLQQGRINTEVQQGLMRTLMVPFSRQVQRLQRVVRQVADESGKQAQVNFAGVDAELDRNVLERMTAPLEHLLRNAVVHGIEMPSVRVAADKPKQGQINVSLYREGTQLVIELTDDGAGMNIAAIRTKAIERGLMPADAEAEDRAIVQFIFEPGFSTAEALTQSAGRGVGMDVVAAEVKQLGGTLELGSETGKGSRFVIRLPLTLAISQALLVSVGGETYAVSLSSIQGIARIPVAQLPELLAEDSEGFDYGDQKYPVHYLGDFLNLQRPDELEGRTVPAVMVRVSEGLGGNDRRVAVVIDSLLGNREIVSKAVGPQVSSVLGVSGATILADGRVVLILDIAALVQDHTRRELLAEAAGTRSTEKSTVDEREMVMVVDDSITMRRVAERLLTRNGYRVVTAKDGLDAIAQLQTETPAAVLLDIEMPRADGFEVATFIRNSERIASTPIIMITSRSGDKHRDRARQIGVDRYLIKPYQEEQLMQEVTEVTAAASKPGHG